MWLAGSGATAPVPTTSRPTRSTARLGPDDPAFSETTPYSHPIRPTPHRRRRRIISSAPITTPTGCKTTTSNCSNNYGPYQFPEKLIPLFLINALHGRPLPIYGDGMQVRDWLHVEDHCRGIVAVLERGRVGETYNIGGGAELPNLTVIDTLCAAVDAAFVADAGLSARFPHAPAARGEATASLKTTVADRPGHDRRYAIDERKARADLGYAPQRSFAQGFAATLAWYLANEPWWRSVLDGSYRDWVKANYAAR